MFAQALILIFLGLMVFAAFNDAVKFRIPNWLCLAVAALFPVYGIAAGLDLSMWGGHLLGGLIGLLLGMALFAPGFVGGGDAKLFASAALWFGWGDFLPYLYLTAVAGGMLVLLLIGLRRALPAFAGAEYLMKNQALAQGGPVPYGIALAAGAFWCLPNAGILPLV